MISGSISVSSFSFDKFQFTDKTCCLWGPGLATWELAAIVPVLDLAHACVGDSFSIDNLAHACVGHTFYR